MARLPSGDGFANFVCVDLDDHGDLLDPATGRPVPADGVVAAITSMIKIPDGVTDIVVFVHGWRNDRDAALAAGRRLFSGIESRYAAHAADYPAIQGFRGYYVLVRWPSMSNPLPWGYRRIRNRAHAMTTDGQADFVLGTLLGYVHDKRRKPGRATLRARGGQYLHCVGHSFGGRFLGEAIMAAASPTARARLSWPWGNSKYPFTIDSLVVFQMAAVPTVFQSAFAPVLSDAPISGPIVLTFSRSDRANRLWHRIIEHVPGIGAFGATEPSDQIAPWRLLEPGHRYEAGDLRRRIRNVDAGWCFRRGRVLNPAGAHSDIWYDESVHLVLSLAALAR